MISFQDLPQGDVEEDPSLHSGRVLPPRLPPLKMDFFLMSKHQLWLLQFWSYTIDRCSKHLTLKFSTCTFSSQLFGEQIMTQNLFSRNLPYFVIPCDMSLIQTLGLLVQFQFVSQTILLNKEIGSWNSRLVKAFQLMYHFGSNFLYCSMNVKCEPNNVILKSLKEIEVFQNVDRT